MYLGWRLLGVELPWEKVALCRRAHATISFFHRGRRIPNLALFTLTWLVVGWYRLDRVFREATGDPAPACKCRRRRPPRRAPQPPPEPPATAAPEPPVPAGPFKWPRKPLSDFD
jgi:hypothetical protein